jgi:phage shock protein PspC (stress-responsive transcriptional regulator)
MEKRLYRSRSKKVVAGIGGGLGEYLDIDPVIIRIIIVLITIFNGIGLLVYIIMWIVVPEESSSTASETIKSEDATEGEPGTDNLNPEGLKNSSEAKSSSGRLVFGIILIVFGLVFLSEKYFPFLDFEFVFAVGLIALGVSLLFNFFNKRENI